MTKRLLLLSASVLVTLLMAELALRSLEGAHPPRQKVTPEEMHIRDPELGHRMGLNVSVVLKRPDFAIRVKTNSLGFRGPEIGPKGANTFRILSLGDSYAFGYGVEADETYSEQLEQLLGKSEGEADGFEVVNAAVIGYGTTQELQLLERHASAIDPDLVLLGFFSGNDFKNNLVFSGRFRKSFDYPALAWLVRHSRLFAWIETRLKNAELKLRWREAVDVTMEIIRELAGVCEYLGAPLAILVIIDNPDRFVSYYERNVIRLSLDRAIGYDPRQLHEEFVWGLRSLGIPMLDTWAVLEGVDTRDGLTFPITEHWTSRTHGIIAQALREFLLARGLVQRLSHE